MTDKRKHIQLIQGTLGNRLGIIIVSALTMLFFVSLIAWFIKLSGLPERTVILMTSTVQDLLLFIFPAWLAAFLASPAPNSYLGVNREVSLRQFIGVVILAFISMPAMNYLIHWNEGISFPEAMAGIERIFRKWEDGAAQTTQNLLGDTSVAGLISGVLVIGVLTGIAEEMFFRAGIQNALTSAGWNHHVAIWLTAFLFSAIHFQFFGFLPRMILGAAFGYIFFTTKSLWISAFAHALNNSIVVVVEWLKARGVIGFGPESWGIEGEHAWVWTLASFIVTALFIAIGWNKLFRIKEE